MELARHQLSARDAQSCRGQLDEMTGLFQPVSRLVRNR
jgi:hypothetical protein